MRISPGGNKELRSRLASHLMQIKEGERLPSIKELATLTHMSAGSVSLAIRSLEDIGAVKIERRGRLGSFIQQRSLGKLWSFAEADPLVIAMTLPMHLRFEGLATALKRLLSRAEIAVYLIFIRGSRTRLEALRENRCHVAVISGLAANKLCSEGEEIVMKLPPGSWIADYSVFYRAQLESGRRVRVAIDEDSFDHRFLTELEFADQVVEFRRVSYIQLPYLIKSGQIDATVWTLDQAEAFLSPEIMHRPLSARVMGLVGEDSLSAAFVIRKGDDSVRAALEAAINVEELSEIQQKVLAGQIIPEY